MTHPLHPPLNNLQLIPTKFLLLCIPHLHQESDLLREDNTRRNRQIQALKKPPKSNDCHITLHQLNMTYTISPDISTSSLVSASEHYNGGSLINDNVCSPQTSNSSPDTPEWSLIDSFHKGAKNNALSNAKKNIAK